MYLYKKHKIKMNKNKYRKTGIYLLKIDKYRYVGQSIDIIRRVSNHKNQLKNNKHGNNRMQNVFNKYNTFEYVILWEGPREFLTILEQVYINMLNKNIILNIAPAKKRIEDKKLYSPKVKTERHIKAVKKWTASMNTPEANSKSAKSRKNNINVINSRRKREDQTVYIFINKRTKEKWQGLRINFASYLNVNNASARVSEILRGKPFRGWELSSECNFTFISPTITKGKKGIDSSTADKTIYSFIHNKTNKEFVGTRYDFAEYIEVSSKQLSGLIHMRDKTYHKWKLNCCSLKGHSPR
jgi:hypothetical protein